VNKIEQVGPYKAKITQEILDKWNGFVRVWNEPMSAVEGAEIVAEITEPTEVTVTEEQKDIYGSTSQRARVTLPDGRQGWVIFEMIAKEEGAPAS
jgi:hypothetical protein